MVNKVLKKHGKQVKEVGKSTKRINKSDLGQLNFLTF